MMETEGDGCRQAGVAGTCLCGKSPCRGQKPSWGDVLPLGHSTWCHHAL